MCSELKFYKTQFLYLSLFILKYRTTNKQHNSYLMYRKHVNTRSSYCVSVVGVYKLWLA
jgi:hypothetical protein